MKFVEKEVPPFPHKIQPIDIYWDNESRKFVITGKTKEAYFEGIWDGNTTLFEKINIYMRGFFDDDINNK